MTVIGWTNKYKGKLLWYIPILSVTSVVSHHLNLFLNMNIQISTLYGLIQIQIEYLVQLHY